MDISADGAVLSESGACLLFDGQNGVGQWISEQCCGHAVRIAQNIGIGMVVARDSNHFGAAAWWAQKIRDHGMIGMVFCNASPLVPPWQGKQGRIGTNPICMAAPGPWLLDMATTTVAANRIFQRGSERARGDSQQAGRSIPTASPPPARRRRRKAC